MEERGSLVKGLAWGTNGEVVMVPRKMAPEVEPEHRTSATHPNTKKMGKAEKRLQKL